MQKEAPFRMLSLDAARPLLLYSRQRLRRKWRPDDDMGVAGPGADAAVIIAIAAAR